MSLSMLRGTVAVHKESLTSGELAARGFDVDRNLPARFAPAFLLVVDKVSRIKAVSRPLLYISLHVPAL